ncbi:HNH endonuclease [Yoonia algicola]|uniref:HNH endonuclease n=1 Tax=Yoonia algicola TaxID=3137368 RepID=A0AAN0NE19_9RHOB
MCKKTKKLMIIAANAQKWRCYYCDYPIWDKDHEEFAKTYALKDGPLRLLRATAEHLIARCDGGADTQDNIVAACDHCNKTRHKAKVPLSPLEFRAKVRRRLAKGRWHSFRNPQITVARKKSQHTPRIDHSPASNHRDAHDNKR